MLICALRSIHMMTAPAVQRRCFGSHTARKIPLILVLGATGTGKSDLAIQLAQGLSQHAFPNHGGMIAGAEIINADAMQLYHGLPVITNKVTVKEQQGIPHHLLDHINVEDEPWTVQQYVEEADRVIKDIRSRGKLPIVVGGTGYYVYGLLFKNALVEKADQEDGKTEDEVARADFGKEAGFTWPILNASTAEIYTKLQEVDPEQARRWHPNDRRKIQRSLEIYLRFGRKASDIYKEQKQGAVGQEFEEGGVHGDDNGLRYDPLIFWLEADDKVLKDRLDRRVDVMVQNGLLDEAQEMGGRLAVMSAEGILFDKSKGIWVSIGYKEMEPWVEVTRNHQASKEEVDALKSTCIEAVKSGTRQYAKRQNRFIRLRLANALSNAKASHRLFLLDCTDREQWRHNVQQPASEVVYSFLSNESLPDPAGLSELAKNIFASMADGKSLERVARRCETCDKVLMTEKEWNNHISSNSHKRMLQGIRKRQSNQERMNLGRMTNDGGPDSS